MRYLKYLFVFIFAFTACKTKKYALDNSVIAKKMSAKKVARKHVSANFKKKTIAAKFKVNFNDGITKQSISVYLRIKKDEVIWLKGTKFINVFKALKTSQSGCRPADQLRHHPAPDRPPPDRKRVGQM